MSQPNNDVDDRSQRAARRAETDDVRKYLEALDASRVAQSSPWSLERSERRQAEIQDRLGEAVAAGDRLKSLELTQELIDAVERVEQAKKRDQQAADLARLQQRFEQVGQQWALRVGISYRAFRRCGVPAEVLRAAKIGRTV